MTKENGGQTLYAKFEVAANAYILCGSLVPSRRIMSCFNTDSAIVIFDTRGFGEAVSRMLPNCREGFDGPCSYQGKRIIQRCDLGHHEFGPMTPVVEPSGFSNVPADAQRPTEIERLFPLLASIAGREVYFLKEMRFLEQNEWRFVWLIDGVAESYLDICVPEAIRFCARWEDLGELIAF